MWFMMFIRLNIVGLFPESVLYTLTMKLFIQC